MWLKKSICSLPSFSHHSIISKTCTPTLVWSDTRLSNSFDLTKFRLGGNSLSFSFVTQLQTSWWDKLRADSPSVGHGWTLRKSCREFRQILLVFHISEVYDPLKSSCVGSVAVHVYLWVCVDHIHFICLGLLSYYFRCMNETKSSIFIVRDFLSQRMVQGGENSSAVFWAENTCVFIQALWGPWFMRLLQSAEGSLV